ncbi:MAG: hypothetical protein ABFC63_07140 [Thermoguttaceae bacterium]
MIAPRIRDTFGEGKKRDESDVRLVTENWRSSILLADSDEYKEGEAASCRGLTTRDNPYRFLSPEYWRWQEGLLGNCSADTAKPRFVSVDSRDHAIEFLGDEEEAAVAIVAPEYVESDAVLVGAS